MARLRPLKSVRILFNDRPVSACVVGNMSAAGALLAVSNVANMPNEFLLDMEFGNQTEPLASSGCSLNALSAAL
jgi:hypothetical protein